jgi:small subunit ribosomal protein S26e
MPVSTAPYRREYAHTASRGSEGTVTCTYCGRQVPRWKAFTKFRGFRINDPTLMRQIPRYQIHTFSQKVYVCPSCARSRKIVQPGKSVRKKHLNF